MSKGRDALFGILGAVVIFQAAVGISEVMKLKEEGVKPLKTEDEKALVDSTRTPFPRFT